MIEHIIHIAQSAGRIIEQVRRDGFDVESKGREGPVTHADRAADDLLRRELLALEPCGWLSEETADNHDRLHRTRLWVVDPLDGTKEFVEGVPNYCVAVALVDDGMPQLGVVHNPATGETYWAERGAGAFKNGNSIAVTEGNHILASRSEIKRGEFAPFVDDWEVTAVGSIEYKLARIAAGDGAVTFSRGPKWEWDVCAGSLLVEEAGGVATDLFGGALRYNQKHPKVRGVLAGAPLAVTRVNAEIARLGASDRMNELA